MYQSPINVFSTQPQMNLTEEIEGKLVCEVSAAVGFDVDREAMIKALRYDRNQYKNGREDAIAEVKEVIESMRNGDDIEYMNQWQVGYHSALNDLECRLSSATFGMKGECND